MGGPFEHQLSSQEAAQRAQEAAQRAEEAAHRSQESGRIAAESGRYSLEQAQRQLERHRERRHPALSGAWFLVKLVFFLAVIVFIGLVALKTLGASGISF